MIAHILAILLWLGIWASLCLPFVAWRYLDPVFGIYRHYKGDLYLGLCRSWESDNDAGRVRRVLYWSLKDWQLDDRTETEFLWTGKVCPDPLKPRFERLFPPWQPRVSKGGK